MDGTIGGDDAARRVILISPQIGYRSPRLGDQQSAGGNIVEIEIVFPITVIFAGGHIGEIDGGGTASSDITDFRQKFGKNRQIIGSTAFSQAAKPVARIAWIIFSHDETVMGAPFRVAPPPFSARKSWLRAGA
jgi:hypothetical protein